MSKVEWMIALVVLALVAGALAPFNYTVSMSA